jgi:hypothetical protein
MPSHPSPQVVPSVRAGCGVASDVQSASRSSCPPALDSTVEVTIVGTTELVSAAKHQRSGLAGFKQRDVSSACTASSSWRGSLCFCWHQCSRWRDQARHVLAGVTCCLPMETRNQPAKPSADSLPTRNTTCSGAKGARLAAILAQLNANADLLFAFRWSRVMVVTASRAP